MRKDFLLALLILLFFSQSFAQENFPEFGEFSNDEMAMKETSLDTNAEAVVLLDYAFAHHDDEYQLITERRVRIKILNQRGLDRASISIPFYSQDDFEFIMKVEGVTYTPGEKSVKLSKKSVFTEKRDNKFSIIKFAMPNVKVGSIIEYKYTSVMKHYGGLDNWIFQSDIPTIRSCYKLQVLPNSNFEYLLFKKPEYPVVVSPPAEGMISFEMTNIPGLKFEPYMDAPKDYLQKVDFKLSSFVNSRGSKLTFNTSWKELVKSLLSDESFGTALNKKISIPDDLKNEVEKETTDVSKVATIYKYVKDNFIWNGYNSKYIIDGLKKVWESKTGSSGELNLLMVNLLQAFKLDAKPLLVAERNFGRVDPQYVYIDKFNKAVACITIGGKMLVLDVTEKYLPVTLIPYSLLNTYALIIDKNTSNVIEIGSSGQAFTKRIQVNAKINTEGLLSGNCIISDYGYAKASQMKEIKDDKERRFIKNYETTHDGIKVEGYEYTYNDTDSLPLMEQFKISQQMDNNGGFALFNYNLFTGLTKNPFTSGVRFTNINFGYPYTIEVEETIELPENAKTDNLAKDVKLEKLNGMIKLSRTIKRAGNTLKIKIVFTQTVSLLAANAYFELKEIYKSMVDLLNEPVVIKL